MLDIVAKILEGMKKSGELWEVLTHAASFAGLYKGLKAISNFTLVKKTVQGLKYLADTKLGKAVNKATSIFMHPTVTAAITVTLCASAFAAASVATAGALPAACLAAAGFTFAYNTYNKTAEIMKKKDLIDKNNCLNHIKEARLQKNLLIARNPELAQQLNLKSEVFKKDIIEKTPKQNSLIRSSFSAIREACFELGTPIFLAVTSGNPVLLAMATAGAAMGGVVLVASKHVEKNNKETLHASHEFLKEEMNITSDKKHEIGQQAVNAIAEKRAFEKVSEEYQKDPLMSQIALQNKFALYKDQEKTSLEQGEYKNILKQPTFLENTKIALKTAGEVIYPLEEVKEPSYSAVVMHNDKLQNKLNDIKHCTNNNSLDHAPELLHSHTSHDHTIVPDSVPLNPKIMQVNAKSAAR